MNSFLMEDNLIPHYSVWRTRELVKREWH